MRIEVGMYVRTDNGIIGRIYEKIGDMFTYKNNNRDYITYGTVHNEIIKASFDIIDLIEVGDYVNGAKVNRLKKDYIVIHEIWSGREYLSNEEIKTIVTKEQFGYVSYKIEV